MFRSPSCYSVLSDIFKAEIDPQFLQNSVGGRVSARSLHGQMIILLPCNNNSIMSYGFHWQSWAGWSGTFWRYHRSYEEYDDRELCQKLRVSYLHKESLCNQPVMLFFTVISCHASSQSHHYSRSWSVRSNWLNFSGSLKDCWNSNRSNNFNHIRHV